MDESNETVIDTTPEAVTGTCACGCGGEVAPGKTWVRGHHGRGRPTEQPAPDEDLTLVALTPGDMVPAQTELRAWCDRKVAAVQTELADLAGRRVDRCRS